MGEKENGTHVAKMENGESMKTQKKSFIIRYLKDSLKDADAVRIGIRPKGWYKFLYTSFKVDGGSK